DDQRGKRQGDDDGKPRGHLADGVANAHCSLPEFAAPYPAIRVPEYRGLLRARVHAFEMGFLRLFRRRSSQ
ncbi:hypothetical protein DD788_28765, partial [Ralstonia pickettii]|nr:hypothetical protein [Ralstonia pickettii]